MEDEILKPLIAEVNKVFQSAEAFMSDFHKTHPLRERIQEAWFKTKAIAEQLDADVPPNWYVLYEGLCGSHIELRNKHKLLQSENNGLRSELKILREKLYASNEQVNRLLFGDQYSKVDGEEA